MNSIPLFENLRTEQNAKFGLPGVCTFNFPVTRVFENAEFRGTSLPDLLNYLDGGGRVHPQQMARIIKRVNPGFSAGDIAAGRNLDDEYQTEIREQQRLDAERAAATGQMAEAIKRTPEPTQALLDHLNLTLEKYAKMREALLAQQ